MAIQVSENQIFAIYRVYTRLDFLVLPINIFVVWSITKLILISNWDFIEQIIVFISNCRASAHLDFEELICFRSAEYNSVYQLFLVRGISRTRISWYTRRYLSICTRNYWYAARCIDMYQNMSAKNIIFSGQKWFTK